MSGQAAADGAAVSPPAEPADRSPPRPGLLKKLASPLGGLGGNEMVDLARRGPRPSVAPQSDFAKALKADLAARPAKLFRLHKPSILKKMQQGKDQYYRRKTEKLAGKLITTEHAFYHLSYGMMLGIWYSLNGVTRKEHLVLDDFAAETKVMFPKEGSRTTPPLDLPAGFEFKDYAPKVFHNLRDKFDIDDVEYQRSLGGYYEYIEFISNSKSGQFFFFSHDGKYMIKTQTVEESKFLRRILLHYYEHCMDNPNTYLPRFYGMHRIEMPHINRKLHFVVMHSVFDSGDRQIHRMFDLKGSTYGRITKQKDIDEKGDKVVLKDLNLLDMGFKLHLGEERRANFLLQLRRDADWLRRMKIMDYSLLVGVRDPSRDVQDGDLATNPLEGMAMPPMAASAAAATGAGGPPQVAGGSAESDAREQYRQLKEAQQRHSAMRRSRGRASMLPVAPARMSVNPVVAAREGASSLSRARSYGGNLRTAAQSTGGQAGTRPGRSWYGGREDTNDEEGDEEGGEDEEAKARAPFPPTCAEVASEHTQNGRPQEYYYLGIIDILQQYNFKKRAETVLRGAFEAPAATISAVTPAFYAKRFVEFLTENSD